MVVMQIQLAPDAWEDRSPHPAYVLHVRGTPSPELPASPSYSLH